MIEKILMIGGAIIGSVGSASLLIIGLSTWLGKVWATRIYEDERKKHEEQLKDYQSQLDMKLSSFNSELDKLSHESKLRFSVLHQERIEIIKELYKRLIDLEDYMNIFTQDMTNGKFKSNDQSALSNYANLLRAMPNFMNYTNANRIFFSEEIVFNIKEVEALFMILMNVNEHTIRNDKWDEGGSEKWNEVMSQMTKKDIPEFREKLEYEFRSLLGVIDLE